MSEELTIEEQATNAQTWRHIYELSKLLHRCQKNLMDRIENHDQSKLKKPEVAGFTEFTPKLKDLEYGTEAYKKNLEEMQFFIQHQYENNSHHPEHYENGVNDMSLFDVLEMLMDWWVSTKRGKNGDIHKSIDFQQERFGISDQLTQILRNTIAEMEKK